MSNSESPLFFDPQHPLAHSGKKIVFAVSILAAVVFYYLARYSKEGQIVTTLTKVAPLVLVGMLIAETAYLVFQGGLLRKVYQMVGYKRTPLYLIGMYLGMNLVNTVAPVVGISGSLYMMHFEKQRGLNRSDTFLINFLYYLTDYIVFLIVLLAVISFLMIRGEITPVILKTSLVFAGFVVVVVIAGVSAFSHPTFLHKAVHFVNRTLGKLRRKGSLIADEVIDHFVIGAKDAWKRSRKSWLALVEGGLYAFLLHIACITMLWLAFRAFQVNVTVQIIVAGYTVGTLLNIVSITPSGIGFAEGGMTAVFAALGVPVEQALIVTLLYRAFFTFYPLLLGMVALHFLHRLAAKQEANSAIFSQSEFS